MSVALRSEDGFSMVMVFLGLTIMTIMGAMSLLLAASSVTQMANMRPEDRCFRIADSATAEAHAKIVSEQIHTTPYIFSGSSQGGTYNVTVTGSKPYWTVVCEASYVDDETTYRRKIQEKVTYWADQAFDAMRNYIFFAGNNLTIRVSEGLQSGTPVRINGNMRAQNQTSLYLAPFIAIGDGFTINGRVEGVNGVYAESTSSLVGIASDLTINGDILTNGTARLRANGTWLLLRLWGWLYVRNVYAQNIVKEQLAGNGIRITQGEHPGSHPLGDVYVPEASFDYFRTLAQQQGNYFVGDKSFNGESLSQYGGSSMTVIYATGNMNVNGFNYDSSNMHGVFVCEGDFTASGMLNVQANAQFSVISGGNIYFSGQSASSSPTTDEYFLWSGNDIVLDMGLFAGVKMQATALHNITVNSGNFTDLFGQAATLNYGPPDIDITGFPIDVTVNEWKELPSE
jgi:hypothetical protein